MLGLNLHFPAKPDVADFAKLAVGVIVFLLLLIFPPPPLLNSIVMDQHNWIALLLLIMFFIFLLNRKENGWEIVQITFIFALFAIPLVYKWQFAHYDGYIIGGLLPWSDAAAYNSEAHLLANGSLLGAWGARRPLFSGFLAVLLRLTGDFVVILIILTLLNILAVYFGVRVVKQLYGPIGATLFLVISFLFYARFSGVTTSEQLGFAAGNLAFFFLLIGAHTRSLWKVMFGLGLLTLALNARAGAFFILPALILWLAFFFRKQTTFWRAAGSGILVIVTVFLLNLILVRVIAEPQGAAFSNYSYTLYGLASGNKGWEQVNTDYPGIAEHEILPLAIQKIRSEPSLLMKGMIGAFADYFSWDRGGAFTIGIPSSIRRLTNYVLWGLIVSGLVYSFSKWKEGLQSLMLASFFGVFASIPLLPPMDSDGMRVYAATIPFTALWVVTGVFALSTWKKNLIRAYRKLDWDADREARRERRPRSVFFESAKTLEAESIIQKMANDRGKATGSYFQKPALFSSVLLVFLAVPAPLLLKALVPAPNSSNLISQPACKPGQELISGIKSNNMNIIIIPNDATAESYMPFIRIRDFQGGVRRFATKSLYPFLDEELLKLKEGDQISFGLKSGNLTTDSSLWMVSRFPVMPDEFNLCGRATDNKELQFYKFYYLEGATVPASPLTASQENPSITQLMRLLYGMTIGIILFLGLRESIGFTQHSWVEFLFTIGIMIVILQGIFVSLYANGQLLSVLTPPRQRIILQMQNVIVEKGNMYVLPLGIDWVSQADLEISPAIVYENSIPLKGPNSQHQTIREEGNGLYSVWEGKLYFSSSDNTDPRANGRVYELEWPRPIPLSVQWLSFLISILGIALIFLGKRITHMWTSKPEKSLEANRADQQL